MIYVGKKNGCTLGLEQKKGRQEEDKDQITSLPFVNENAQKKKTTLRGFEP